MSENFPSNEPAKIIVHAAKDPVQVPSEPWVVELAARCLCVLGKGHDCFTLTNVYGDVRTVPFDASREDWVTIAESLLKNAMETTNSEEAPAT